MLVNIFSIPIESLAIRLLPVTEETSSVGCRANVTLSNPLITTANGYINLTSQTSDSWGKSVSFDVVENDVEYCHRNGLSEHLLVSWYVSPFMD